MVFKASAGFGSGFRMVPVGGALKLRGGPPDTSASNALSWNTTESTKKKPMKRPWTLTVRPWKKPVKHPEISWNQEAVHEQPEQITIYIYIYTL